MMHVAYVINLADKYPAYTLWMYKRAIFGEVANEAVATLVDIKGLELLVFVLLAAAVLWLGIYPQGLLHMLHASSDHLLQMANLSKL